MPENEKPPAMRGDLYYAKEYGVGENGGASGRPAVFHSSSTANAVPLLPQEKATGERRCRGFVHYSLFIFHSSFFKNPLYKLKKVCYNKKTL